MSEDGARQGCWDVGGWEHKEFAELGPFPSCRFIEREKNYLARPTDSQIKTLIEKS
jgi:hypothetical protein